MENGKGMNYPVRIEMLLCLEIRLIVIKLMIIISNQIASVLENNLSF